jgi:hypothetical protein
MHLWIFTYKYCVVIKSNMHVMYENVIKWYFKNSMHFLFMWNCLRTLEEKVG